MAFLVSQNKDFAIRTDEVMAMYVVYRSCLRWNNGDATTKPAFVLTVVQKGGNELDFGEFSNAERAKNALMRTAEVLEGGWGCIIGEDEVSE